MPQLVACDGCGRDIGPSEARQVGSDIVCPACAEKMGVTPRMERWQKSATAETRPLSSDERVALERDLREDARWERLYAEIRRLPLYFAAWAAGAWLTAIIIQAIVVAIWHATHQPPPSTLPY